MPLAAINQIIHSMQLNTVELSEFSNKSQGKYDAAMKI